MNPPPEVHRLYPLVPPGVPEHSVLRCIGSGSYGEVWLAKHSGGEYRAVKFVSRQMFQRERPFEREFTGILKYEPVSRSHEGLIDILHVGRDDTAGVFFYVMELGDDAFLGRQTQPERYIPKTLRAEIDAHGRLPFEDCLRMAVALTSALGHLHEHRLVHRDIKPSNVIFVDGQAKLADIGLVAEAHEARSYVGTEGFIPPEGPGTPQADLYGLGKTIYEAATGKDRNEFPALPADLAGSADHQRLLELNEVILKACANELPQRYESAAEMLADLALLQSGRSVRHARALERRLETAKKLGRIAAVLALLAAGAYFFAQIEARRARQAEHTANDHLVKAYLAQARAGRMSGVPCPANAWKA
jgi:serine/threonine protein kinase